MASFAQPVVLTRRDVDSVNDPYTAARLYLELRRQLHDPALPTGQRTETKAAMNKLLRTWPEAEHTAATASDDDLGGLGPVLKRTRAAHRQERGVTAQAAAAERRRSHKPEAPAAAKPKLQKREPGKGGARRASAPRAAGSRPATKAGRAVSRRADRVGRQVATAATAPVAGWGVFAMQAIGASVFFSVLWAVLSNANSARGGTAAVELFGRSVVNGMHLLIAPTDPLRKPDTTSVAKPALGDAVLGAVGNSISDALTKPALKPVPRPPRPVSQPGQAQPQTRP